MKKSSVKKKRVKETWNKGRKQLETVVIPMLFNKSKESGRFSIPFLCGEKEVEKFFNKMYIDFTEETIISVNTKDETICYSDGNGCEPYIIQRFVTIVEAPKAEKRRDCTLFGFVYDDYKSRLFMAFKNGKVYECLDKLKQDKSAPKKIITEKHREKDIDNFFDYLMQYLPEIKFDIE